MKVNVELCQLSQFSQHPSKIRGLQVALVFIFHLHAVHHQSFSTVCFCTVFSAVISSLPKVFVVVLSGHQACQIAVLGSVTSAYKKKIIFRHSHKNCDFGANVFSENSHFV